MTVNVCDTANFSVKEEVSRSFSGDEVNSEARAETDDEVDSEARAERHSLFSSAD